MSRLVPKSILGRIPDEVMLGFIHATRSVLQTVGRGTSSQVRIGQIFDATERFVKYSMAIKRRQLKRLVIFVTDSCHSRCLHCGIWRVKQPKFLPLSTFEKVLEDVDGSVDIILTGGEPIEHPQIEEMIGLMMRQGRNFTLLSNGNYPERLIELVEKYRIPNLILSCDGLRDTYKRMRGVDWFPNIERIIRDLRGKTNVTLTFTISFWNSRKDLADVTHFSQSNGATLSVGIHGDCASVHSKIPMRLKKLYPVADLIANPIARRYYALYQDWLEGKVFLPCFSVRYTGTVYADEKFGICEAKDIIVGDLTKKTVEEIWNDAATIRLQSDLMRCNGCWLTHYRKNDVAVSELMAKMIPHRILTNMIGDFDWAKVSREIPLPTISEHDHMIPLQSRNKALLESVGW